MMVAVFATMSLALICGWAGRQSLAVALFAAWLLLSTGLFLFEIYSPEYGFRMPWIQTEFDGAPHVRS
jgi:Family of unknown function (DUF5993)